MKITYRDDLRLSKSNIKRLEEINDVIDSFEE